MSSTQIPADLLFQSSHEWARVDGDTATVGISDHAQHELTDVVYVELPQLGKTVDSGDPTAVVESVKAASDIYAPATGEVIESNAALADTPGDVNAEPTGKGWFFKLKLADKGELDGLMDEAGYEAFVKSLG